MTNVSRPGVWFFVILCGWASTAQARVFDLKNEHFAIYFGGTFGSSNTAATAFAPATPTDVVYDKQVSSAAAGEAGLLFAGTRFNFLVGAEYLIPRSQMGVNGTDEGGTSFFSLNSEVSAIAPVAFIEYMPYRGVASRALIGLGYGYAFVSLSNEYKMTAAGAAKFLLGDYKETGSGTAPLVEGYAGWEFVFTDTATMVLKAGYRYCVVRSILSAQDANAIPGTQKSGQEILNYDGTSRKMDLGGGYVGLNFHFFL